MKAILEFNLPEEQQGFDDAVNAGRYRVVLQGLDEVLKRWYECQDNEIFSDVRDKLYSLCNEQGVDVYD